MALTLAGCANPGPPHAPSLFLPEPVKATKISTSRIGNSVDVRFTVPARSTDNLPLRAPQLTGLLCRQPETGPCVPVTGKLTVAAKAADGQPGIVTWHDTLPSDLAAGEPRIIGYRVEFFNGSGVSGGESDLVIAAAGQAPPAVEGLTAEGSRSGIVLRWKPAGTEEVIIRREDIARTATTPASRNHPEPGVVWLSADAASSASGESNRILDASALPDVAYRYTAQRRIKVQLASRELELRSNESAPVNFTLLEIYAPSAPTGLTAVGFSTADSQFAADLIWQPVNERAVTGYNVYRTSIDSSGASLSQRTRIGATKAALPGFHDASADAGTRYRYEVTAIDAHGNESSSVSTLLEPTAH